MSEIQTQFEELFIGNSVAYGTEQGGSIRCELWDWQGLIRKHLDGSRPIGVYPMRWTTDGWHVKWGCVDFDEGDEPSFIHAQNLRSALAQFDICAWVERSRSKGYHVWVFLTEWTDPALVRFALLAACQLVDAPTKEINPKQVTLAEGQLGNYVRLPYPGGVPTPEGRRCMVGEFGVPLPLDHFLRVAKVNLTTPQQLEPLRELYKEPVRHVPVVDAPTIDGDPVRRMGGLAYTIWKDGPLDGSDRSGTLFKLSALLREGGQHTFGEAMELVWEADGRWGKFHNRPSGYDDLRKVVEAAWR